MNYINLAVAILAAAVTFSLTVFCGFIASMFFIMQFYFPCLLAVVYTASMLTLVGGFSGLAADSWRKVRESWA